MQNLRDQLLKAGIITEEQKSRAEEKLDRRQPKGRRDAKDRADSKAAAPKPKQEPNPDKELAELGQKPKLSKKQLMKQPVNRMLDLSDPKTLRIYQAIEAHRVREQTKGEIPFHFTLRDGRVRKILVNPPTSEGLEAGRLAIVEDGEPGRHVIVSAEAVSIIREADAEAVRFANS